MKKILLILFLAGFTACSDKNGEKTGLEGRPLPVFNLLLADSITHFNTQQIPKGKPIALFYFGPYCPYSHAQMEEIIDNMHSLQNIQFYVFTTWPYSDMRNFYTHYQLEKYPNITVGLDYTNFVGSYFHVKGVPYMAIYGKDKRLHQSFIGEISSNQIKRVAED